MPIEIHYFLCHHCRRSWKTREEALRCESTCGQPRSWSWSDGEADPSSTDDINEMIVEIIRSHIKKKPKAEYGHEVDAT